MRVLVDTSVWSLGLRRKPEDLIAHQRRLIQHLADLSALSRSVETFKS